MAREHDNLRTALTWCHSPKGDLALGLHLGGKMWSYWWSFNSNEGIHWLTRLLDASVNTKIAPAIRGQALLGLGNLLLSTEPTRACLLLKEALSLLRDAHDFEGIAISLCSLSRIEGDIGHARQLLIEALELIRGIDGPRQVAREWALFHGPDILRHWPDAAGDPQQMLIDAAGESHQIAAAMPHLGYAALFQGDLRRAQVMAEEALRVAQPMGAGTEAGLYLLAGEAAQLSGDLGIAQTYIQKAWDWGSQHAEAKLWEGANGLALLGRVARDRGDATLAREYFVQVLHIQSKFTPAIWALEGLACVECLNDKYERAARLFGAAEAYRTVVNNPAWQKDRRDQARYVDRTCDQLGNFAYEVARAEGYRMTIEQAVTFALQT